MSANQQQKMMENQGGQQTMDPQQAMKQHEANQKKQE